MKNLALSYPLVSIGLPVFNGEKTLADALNSLLNQDYKNIEIIISDNGSTDGTHDICKEYLSKDGRIKYFRSDINHGSIWNFNQVFKLSRGKYFMWAAHDDNRENSYVKSCVEKLEKNSYSVLCQSITAMYIEGNTNQLCLATLDSFNRKMSLVERYKETLYNAPATAIYGLYRVEAVRKTRLFEKVIATDISFLQELSMYGNFLEVPIVLFNYFGREKWNTIEQDYKVFFGNQKKPWWYFPFVVLFCNHWSRISSSNFSFKTKIQLRLVLVNYEIRKTLIKILLRFFRLFCPEKYKVKIGSIIYWKFMHSPNILVGDKNLFLNRVIKPKLGIL